MRSPGEIARDGQSLRGTTVSFMATAHPWGLAVIALTTSWTVVPSVRSRVSPLIEISLNVVHPLARIEAARQH